MGQAGFQDWITAKKMNQSICLLDKRAKQLCQLIADHQVDPAALQVTADSLLPFLFPEGSHMPPGAAEPESLDKAKARIAGQYATELNCLGNTSPAATAFRDSILAFESVASLGARDYMTIYGVTATESELAGAGLQAFLGFFDQRFRDHDYDLGRMHARSVLQNQALASDTSLMPIVYDPKDIHPIDARLDGLRLNQVLQADLQAFKAGMRRRINQMLREMWGDLVALPAIPGSDLILSSLLDRMIAKS